MLTLATISPPEFTKLIQDYGAPALLVFVTSVTLPISVIQLKKDPSSKLHKAIYVSNWAVAGALMLCIVITYSIVHFRQPAVIKGEIVGLPMEYEVRNGANPDDLYFYCRKDDSDARKGYVKYHWLAMKESKFNGPQTLSIFVYDPTSNVGYSKELKLKLEDSYYEQSLVIDYNAKKGIFTLIAPGKQDSNIETDDVSSSRVRSFMPDGPEPVVYAASSLDEDLMKRRLESSDPMIRRDARIDLAKLGLDALPFIDKALADTNSGPALLLGVLRALDLMGDNISSESQLSGKALKTIVFSESADNADIGKAAQDYIAKRSPLSVHNALTAWLKANQHKGVRLNDIALADKDLLCGEGRKTASTYRLRQDSSLFAEASRAFDQGWSDRQFAEQREQVYFADALYDWGLLLADRAVIEKGKSGANGPQLVQAAKDKFREFLNAVEMPKSLLYGHPDQIKQAKAYLNNSATGFLNPD